LKLKKDALENEILVIKYQQQIVRNGLKHAIEKVSQDGGDTNRNLLKTEIINQNDVLHYCSDRDFESEDLVKTEIYEYKKENCDSTDEEDDIKFQKSEADQKTNIDTIYEALDAEANMQCLWKTLQK